MMRFISAAVVAGLMLASTPSAFGDAFKSSTHKFSANFPAAVEQGAPEDNATDENGKVISRITSFQDSANGRYLAIVMADKYITPYAVSADVYLDHNMKGFLEGIKGTATQKRIQFEGNPAVQFSFDTPDHSIQGQGLLVFIPGPQPSAYMVGAMRMSNATPDDRAKLDAFITSFDIE